MKVGSSFDQQSVQFLTALPSEAVKNCTYCLYVCMLCMFVYTACMYVYCTVPVLHLCDVMTWVPCCFAACRLDRGI